MKTFNILILSSGRRVELVKLFKEAINELGLKGKIICADASSYAPSLFFSDEKEVIPRIESPTFIETIINISLKHDISLIIPTIDTELLPLSTNKKFIEKSTGAKVLISNENLIKICRDKNKTQDFLEENGFKMPKRFKTEEEIRENDFPLFIKPISGSSSINAFKVTDFNQLKSYLDIIKTPIIQQNIVGDEYTVDVFCDFNSRIVSVVPRLRIETRGGEISKGKIVRDNKIIDEVSKLVKIMKPIGHITIQLFKTKSDIYFIEINPRFGGGAPMSIMSGANSCKNLLRILNGDQLDYNNDFIENQIYLRFDSSIVINDEN
ncbi:ATP-grasp domain-containing protein [Haploplasma modicum]|uniref:ATP-grasp domain-containing protein n=1 Tax=Haploplasma modicum TaxID=2150 RepID=UPI00047AC844|nr:ATP-grasp domain-containing protein [Haploplasma modicum]